MLPVRSNTCTVPRLKSAYGAPTAIVLPLIATAMPNMDVFAVVVTSFASCVHVAPLSVQGLSTALNCSGSS